MVILLGIAAFVATVLGGSFALRFRDRLHLILGFSAGAVVAVAFFDLIPEAIQLGSKPYGQGELIIQANTASKITSLVALGFVLFMLLDRMVIFHSHSHGHGDYGHPAHERAGHGAPQRGKLGAGS